MSALDLFLKHSDSCNVYRVFSGCICGRDAAAEKVAVLRAVADAAKDKIMSEERIKHDVVPTYAAIDAMLADGYTVEVSRDVDGKHTAVCINWYDQDEPLVILTEGCATWQEAVEQAASEWAQTGGAG